MSKKTKLILSLIGMSAVIVPAILLIVATSRTKEAPSVPTQDRQIDDQNISDSVNKFSPPPSPLSGSSSASPSQAPVKSGESTSSGLSQ